MQMSRALMGALLCVPATRLFSGRSGNFSVSRELNRNRRLLNSWLRWLWMKTMQLDFTDKHGYAATNRRRLAI